MHTEQFHAWTHAHDFIPDSHHEGERRTRLVIALTAAMMVVEIAAGLASGSMALLADGWHMASHASALGITVFAYAYARRHRSDSRYSFGTGKVSILGGYTSAVVLAVISLFIGAESVLRLFDQAPIQFNEAIAVAVVGLGVNLFCAYLLGDDHDHDPAHEHSHADHNRRAAYLHVLADGLTSAFAVVALACGKAFGWIWMDPFMGMVGAFVIARWSYGLLRETSRVLLDGSADPDLLRKIRGAVELDSDRVADLHLWQVGPRDRAAIISIVTHDPLSPDAYRERLRQVDLTHVTVEVRQCSFDPLPG